MHSKLLAPDELSPLCKSMEVSLNLHSSAASPAGPGATKRPHDSLSQSIGEGERTSKYFCEYFLRIYVSVGFG
jgi:hypothetical protein